MRSKKCRLAGWQKWLIPAVFLALFPTGTKAGEFVLKYDTPAAKWRESLPLGNGHLGVTVSGGVHNERLQLSENSIYSGGWGTLTIDPLEAVEWAFYVADS